MDALQSLGADHRVIRQTLDAFEIYIGYVEAGVPVERFDLQRFVAFFQDFADVYHHDKEEALLFPALVAAGVDWNGDPLLRVRREHDQEHYLMSSLEHSGLQGDAWSDEERRHFLGIAKEFVAFEREHMRFENVEVFPLAERVLSEFARAQLTRDVQRFDEAAGSRKLRASELAEVLKRRYSSNDRSPCEGIDRLDRHFAGPR
ncbi:MAG TPA: hemerythrin domain-containing protein [Polyangiaceae bacterium]